MKETFVEDLDKLAIKKKPELQFHRNNILRWNFMKTIIWGDHRRNYYKISTFEDFSISEKMKSYFGTDYSMSKKKLTKFFELIRKMKWAPIDRLYTRVQIGSLDVKTGDIEKQILDTSKVLDRSVFLETNVLTKENFVIWLLFAADFENIKTFQDVLDNEYKLLTNFERFCKNDILPEDFKTLFNNELSKLEEANIEPIGELNMQDFYNFVIHPAVTTITTSIALKKLFFIISQSPFLKGMSSGSFKPSLRKYTEYLNEIYDLKYNNKKNINLSKFRPLLENEVMIYDGAYSYIKDDFFIPDSIKEKHSFVKSWTVNLGNKGEKVTTEELKKFKRILSPSSSQSVLSIIDQRLEDLRRPPIPLGPKKTPGPPVDPKPIDEALKEILKN